MTNSLVPIISLVFLKYMVCEPHWLRSFSIERPKANNTIILSEIIINYINIYFDEDEKFVSIIFKLLKDDGQSQYEAELLHNLSSVLHEVKCPHIILGDLSNATYDNRNAFNLILVDNITILSLVDLSFDTNSVTHLLIH